MQLVPILAAYLLGSFPSAVLVARFVRADVRGSGSGNPGAANTWRVAGRGAGLIVLFLDGLKGWLAVAAVPVVADETAWWVVFGAAGAAVLGHVFNPWLGLRGGKGVATAAGAIGALAPRLLVGSLAVFAIVFAIRRRVSEASIAAVLALPVTALAYRTLNEKGWPGNGLLALSAGLTVLLLWSHRANLRRIRAGTEPRLKL